MKLYLASTETRKKATRKIKPKNVLISFFYVRNLGDYFKEVGYTPNVFLDSGGYTAMTKGIEGQDYLDAYIKEVKQNKERVTEYANYDLPYNEQKTFENQKYMEEKGLNPLPVVHLGATKEDIEKYKDYNKLCIGGLVPYAKNPEKIKRFVLKVMKYFDGKIHLFGVSNPKLIDFFKNRVESMDSTSWLSGGRYGSFYYFSKTKKKLIVKNSKKFKKYFGASFNKLKYTFVGYWNLTQWKQYVDYLEEDKHEIREN